MIDIDVYVTSKKRDDDVFAYLHVICINNVFFPGEGGGVSINLSIVQERQKCLHLIASLDHNKQKLKTVN